MRGSLAGCRGTPEACFAINDRVSSPMRNALIAGVLAATVVRVEACEHLPAPDRSATGDRYSEFDQTV